MENTRPEISAIITSYYEEKSIDEFYARLSSALKSLNRSYEIIMINDGSTDRTFDRMRALFAQDEHISVVADFFKNAGQLAAMTAGISYARGEAIVFIDSDLQLDPEELPLLVAEYDKGFDLVSGYRKNRKDSLTRIIPSKLANIIMRRAARANLRDFGCTFKIWNGKILRAFGYGPFKLFSNAAISKVGRYTEVPVTHHARKYGKSGWTFRKLWQFNMENVISLSEKPFQVLAALCLGGGLLFTLRLLIELLFPIKLLSQVSSGLLLNVLVIIFLQLVAILAIIGEFTVRCFVMLQNHPSYIVREIIARGWHASDHVPLP